MKDERTFESLPHVLRNLGCGMAVFARLAEYAISIAVKKNITFPLRYTAYLVKYLIIPIAMAQLPRVISLCTHTY